jgi:hypothetical protein
VTIFDPEDDDPLFVDDGADWLQLLQGATAVGTLLVLADAAWSGGWPSLLLVAVRAAGWSSVVPLLSLCFGTLWVLWCLLERSPGRVAAAPLAISAAAAIAGAWLGFPSLSDVELAATFQWSSLVDEVLAPGTVVRARTYGLYGLSVLALCNLPAAVLLGLGGVVSGTRAPRAPAAPAVVVVFAGLAAVFPVAGGFFGLGSGAIFPRVVAYGLGGAAVALSLAVAKPDRQAREGALVTAVAFACVVLFGEIALPAARVLWEVDALPLAPPGPVRVQFYREMLLAGEAQRMLSWITVWVAALAMVPSAVRLSAADPEPTSAGEGAVAGPWEQARPWAPLGVWLLWLLAFASLGPSLPAAPADAGAEVGIGWAYHPPTLARDGLLPLAMGEVRWAFDDSAAWTDPAAMQAVTREAAGLWRAPLACGVRLTEVPVGDAPDVVLRCEPFEETVPFDVLSTQVTWEGGHKQVLVRIQPERCVRPSRALALHAFGNGLGFDAAEAREAGAQLVMGPEVRRPFLYGDLVRDDQVFEGQERDGFRIWALERGAPGCGAEDPPWSWDDPERPPGDSPGPPPAMLAHIRSLEAGAAERRGAP